MNNFQYENLAKKVARIVGDDHAGAKSMWRMTGGCRERAIEVVRAIGTHLNDGPAKTLVETDDDFCDYVLAYIIGGGFEVEWLYWTLDEYKADHELKCIASMAKKAMI